MKVNYSLLAPGPVNLHPKVLESLAQPMLHHRTPEFDKILKKVLNQIKMVFETEQPVYLLSSTGSGGMEACLVNILSQDDHVVAIDSGKFGERWAEMAKVFGARVTVIKVPWGQAVKVGEVEAVLKKEPKTKAVLCQACETSTAVLHPIQELGELIRHYPETLFLVDGITAVGAMKLPMDKWHIDGLIAGSQKAFMLPTGLSMLAFSKKAEKFFALANAPRFYFDIRREKKANEAGETYFSSNVALIRALGVVLDMIEAMGYEKHLQVIARRADFTRLFVGQKLGLGIYPEKVSNSVSAFLMPTHIDGQKARLLLEQKYNITIMGGQDQAKGKILRIGHMGYITDDELVNLIECLGKTLHELDEKFISLERIQTISKEADQFLRSEFLNKVK